MRTLLIISVAMVLSGFAQADEGKITVQADRPGHRISRYLTGACIEDVNHEIYGGLYSQMIFGESFQEPPPKDSKTNLSRLWQPVRRGSAEGEFVLESNRPFTGKQSQQIRFTAGQGELGIENRGLNRWGMYFVEGKPFEGVLWARADKPVKLTAALESADGKKIYAETPLAADSNEWQRLTFTLTPNATEKKGRFAILLKGPGAVDLGYVFLQPGDWGRFKGLPVRRDVGEAIQNLGITVLRYGGSMINHPEYRWKKMTGPRDRRPANAGTWYPYSTNGWGILDFLNFCEAAGILSIPDFNIDETPQDMVDFLSYVNDPATTEWGQKRAADGHPQPYRLRYLELGNEQRVDEEYYEKFKRSAEALWAKDPAITLVVGDFCYGSPISDPMNITRNGGGLKNLAAQQQILKLAKQHGREVWFDVHVGTDGPRPDEFFDGMLSFKSALTKLAEGARQKAVVFEFNAGNHDQRRALGNAIAINAIERDGGIPVAASANGLQPDGQNDNGWDQGLIFLNPSQVWFQPPGYVTQMVSCNYLPIHAPARVEGAALDVSGKRSEDGKTLVLQAVNVSDRAVRCEIDLEGFAAGKATVTATELSGPMRACNTAEKPEQIRPVPKNLPHGLEGGMIKFKFAPRSFTVLKIESK
jgi:hypothetical protein